jgi:hypothetical protein
MNGLINYLEPAHQELWKARAGLMEQVQRIDAALAALLNQPPVDDAPALRPPVKVTTPATKLLGSPPIAADPEPPANPDRPIRSAREWIEREVTKMTGNYTLDDLEKIARQRGPSFSRQYLMIQMSILIKDGKVAKIREGGHGLRQHDADDLTASAGIRWWTTN